MLWHMQLSEGIKPLQAFAVLYKVYFILPHILLSLLTLLYNQHSTSSYLHEKMETQCYGVKLHSNIMTLEWITVSEYLKLLLSSWLLLPSKGNNFSFCFIWCSTKAFFYVTACAALKLHSTSMSICSSSSLDCLWLQVASKMNSK